VPVYLGYVLPEGPEVKRMGFDLSQEISGKLLKEVKVLSGRYSKKPIEGLEAMVKKLPTKIVGVGVHGKFLYILDSSGYNIWSTLGMTGQWSITESKHSRVRFTFIDGKTVYFNDQRNFGTLKSVYGSHALKIKLESLGPDMLSGDVSANQFVMRLRKKEKWNITKALMDQRIISGVGNYIKAESLWLAELSPLRNIEEFTDYELIVLCDAIQDIMKTSYNHGGATFLTHKNFSGEIGDYSSRFLCYNRKLDAEGNEVVKIKTPDGRTTHWAPSKQE